MNFTVLVLIKENVDTFKKNLNKFIDILGIEDELILVNRSSESLKEFISPYAHASEIHSPELNEPKILNNSLKLATKEYILILDASCFPTPSILEELRKTVQERKIVFCRIDSLARDGMSGRADERMGTKATEFFCKMTAFCFNKKVALSIDGFDTDFKAEQSLSHGIIFCKAMSVIQKCQFDFSSTAKVYKPMGTMFIRKNIESKLVEKTEIFTSNITVILAATQGRLFQMLRQSIQGEDEFRTFNANRWNITRQLNNNIFQAKNDWIVLPITTTKIIDSNIIPKFKNMLKTGRVFLLDGNKSKIINPHKISPNMWICFNRNGFETQDDNIEDISTYIKGILQQNLEKEFVKVNVKKGGKPPQTVKYIKPKPVPKQKDYKRKRINYSLQTQQQSKDRGEQQDMISIIIPFMYRGDRFPLFEATIEKLYELTKDDDNIEIIIHEADTEKKLSDKFLLKYELNYMFSYWNEVFHRGWALNVPVIHMNVGEKLVFMDADVIVTEQWLESIKKCTKGVYIGWSVMNNLTQSATNAYINTRIIRRSFDRVRTPSLYGAAGGITVIDKELFKKIGGWPEDFRGTYGGEDNGFLVKLRKFNIDINILEAEVYHLYHGHNTYREHNRALKTLAALESLSMKEWEFKITNPFAELPQNYFIKNYKYENKIYQLSRLWDGFSETSIKEFMTKKPFVTIAMLSFRRPDKLLESLKIHLKNQTPLNLCLRVQGAEELSQEQIDDIMYHVSQFRGWDIQFTKGNYGSGVPRHDVVNRALKHFNTPFILTTDDDMIWKENSLVCMASVLKDNPKIGALGLSCTPNYPVYTRNNNRMMTSKSIQGLNTTDGMGSATTMYRREVFDKCELDSNYYIGWGDLDFCLQMKRAGWELSILDIVKLNAINDWDDTAHEYIKVRYDRPAIANSKKLFFKKWGIQL